MFKPILIVGEREVLDAWRDRRALLSGALYSLMGPGVVGLVSLSVQGAKEVTLAMMSVFTIVAAFAGGMNVALDSIAGERERRSLLPLLMHPVTRLELLLGKWLAVACFDTAGLVLNLIGFAVVFHRVPALSTAFSLLPLAMLAGALQIWLSTLCRGIKEAQTYLSMLVFVPMAIGMFMVFSPVAGASWWSFVPLAGQQVQLEIAMRGGPVSLLQAVALGLATAIPAAVVLVGAASRLERDDVVYGG